LQVRTDLSQDARQSTDVIAHGLLENASILLLCSFSTLCWQGFAAHWPQSRGPLRDNVSREKGLLKSWPEGGPKRAWLATKLGSGYSGPAIVAERIFILSQRNATQWLLCLAPKKVPWGQERGQSREQPLLNETACFGMLGIRHDVRPPI